MTNWRFYLTRASHHLAQAGTVIILVFCFFCFAVCLGEALGFGFTIGAELGHKYLTWKG
jgi:hypothetical protein